jgi:triacylglycerol lipase
MAFAPRPLPQETINGLRPPLAGFPYFQHADRFRFQPDAVDWAVNAWWLADASFLVYGDARFVEEALEKSPLPSQGFRLNWLGTADDNRGMVLSNENTLVIVFRGTRVQVHNLLDKAEIVLYNQSDLRTDSRFLFKAGKGGGRVHSGFADAFAEISDYLDEFFAQRRPGQRLWLTGHSLGGALATLAAAHIGAEAVDGLYTFGSPRVGDAAFTAVLPSQSHFRFVHRDDWVPLIPPEFLGYTHAGELRQVPGHQRRNMRTDLMTGRQAWNSTFASASRSLKFKVGDLPFQIAGLADHAPVYYATLLWNALINSETPPTGE